MNTALNGAITVFRERGYRAASPIDLGAAMQLTAGSIDKAFRDVRGRCQRRHDFLTATSRWTNSPAPPRQNWRHSSSGAKAGGHNENGRQIALPPGRRKSRPGYYQAKEVPTA